MRFIKLTRFGDKNRVVYCSVDHVEAVYLDSYDDSTAIAFINDVKYVEESVAQVMEMILALDNSSNKKQNVLY